jgi:hypothetical protein
VCPSRLSTGSSRARHDDTISKMEEPDLVGERSRSDKSRPGIKSAVRPI